jgi:hypothetical protein
MSLLGHAIVAIWNDILPEQRETFIEWHNREHIPERVAIAGFRRGRRYVAEHGSPEYYTLYEANDAAVLTGEQYLDRLNNPTPWTREATKAFRNTSRGVCETVHSEGPGDGGLLATLRLDSEVGRAAELSTHIRAVLSDIVLTPGICGAHLCVADASASSIETTERKGREVGVPNWIVMIEGSSAGAVDAATDRLLASDLAKFGSTTPIERGLYRLEFSLADQS